MTPAMLALALVAAAPAPKDKPAPPAVVGEWKFESVEEEGKVRPPDAPASRFRFDADGTYQVFARGREVAPRRGYTTDPKADPPALDYNTPLDGAAKGDPLLSIYRIEGDRLTVCRAGPGQSRPTAFAAPAGSGLLVIHFRRVKPGD